MITLSQEEFKKKYGAEAVALLKKPEPKQEEGFVADVKQDLAQRGQNITDSLNSTYNDESTPLQAGFNVAGQVAGAVTDVAGEAAKAVVPDAVKNTLSFFSNKVADVVTRNPKVAEGLNAINSGIDSYQAWAKKNPEGAKTIGGIFNIATLLPIGVGSKTAVKTAIKTGETVAETSGKAIQSGMKSVAETVSNIPNPVKGVLENTAKPENIMQRVARIPKGAQASFEQTAKESVGQYLTKRNIYGDTEEISKQLFNRFNTSRNTADEALANLPGEYQAKPVETALNELFARETRVSSPGALSQDFKRVRELRNKYQAGGLNMSEVNEVKRLFERNVRLDFVKQNLPEGVARSTNLDNALREWQFNQAEKLGLKNLPEINRETRLAKTLLDAIGKEASGSAGNNAIALTDWIILANGDPTAISGFLVKKAFSSQKLRSAVAKKLYKGEVIGTPKAQYGKPKPGLEEFMKR